MRGKQSITKPSFLMTGAAAMGALALLLALTPSSAALTRAVSPDGFGQYPTIQAAADAASPGDTLLLQVGTYTGPGNREIDFLGKDLILTSAAGAESTIIDCEYVARGFYLQSGESRACVIQAVTVAHSDPPSGPGGGIVLSGASPTLRSLVIRDCSGNYGSGVYLAYSTAVIEDCRITGNHASVEGGGIRVGIDCANVEIRGCELRGNSGIWGGGLAVHCDGPVLLEDTALEGNWASWDGGGAKVLNTPSVVMAGVTFAGNSAVNGDGGGLWAADSQIMINGCAFLGNAAVNGGGAKLLEQGSNVRITGTRFYGNTASSGGGGLTVLNWAQTHLTNCSFVANSGRIGRGGGIDAYWETESTLENVIVSHTVQGYGVRGLDQATATFTCCDVFANSDGNYGGQWTDQTGMNGNLSIDPLFCDLGAGILTLTAQSPCLPENNDCHAQIGALGEDCAITVAPGTPNYGRLGSAYPNPFNPATTIPYALAAESHVRIAVYDLQGRLLRELIDGDESAGEHRGSWDGRDETGRELPSGVYLVRLESGGHREERKLTLLR